MGFVRTKQDQKMVRILLSVLTVFLAVCIFTKVWTFVAAVRAPRRVAEATVRESTTLHGVTEKSSPSGSDPPKQLTQKNVLVPRPPKQNPIVEVTGILGSEAFINGRWCKVGDTIGEARVLAVEATVVKVLWDGQTLAYSPIDSPKRSTPDSPQAKRQDASSAGPKPAQERSFQTYPAAAPYAGGTRGVRKAEGEN
jgi:hypothetical protein